MARREQAELSREERRARMHGGAKPAEVEAAPPPPPPVPTYKPGDQMILKARPGFWNYTFGPALLYRGPKSIDEVFKAGEPVVVVADTIPLGELQKLEMSHVRGFVFEQGSAIDEEFYNFLQTQKRAAVLGCQYACYFAREAGWVIVDGVQGMVCFNPSEATLEAFAQVRAKGPPKQERADQVATLLRDMVQAAVEDREKQKAAGTYEDPHDHQLSMSEAVKAQKEAPGFILQLLAGLPIKGAPGAEEAGYREPGADAAGGAEATGKPASAAERRAARQRGRADGGAKGEGAGEAGHDHAHDHDEQPAGGAAAGGGGGSEGAAEPGAGADGRPDPFAGLSGAALRRAQREQETLEAQRRRAEG